VNGYIEAGYLFVGVSLSAYGGHLAVQRRRLERRCRQAFGGDATEPTGPVRPSAAPRREQDTVEGRQR
jgi:hypothetical protein